MKITVLGCYGSEESNRRCAGFLINSTLMMDAGTIVAGLDGQGLGRIRYVLISHNHLDHVKDLFFLADMIADRADQPIALVSTEPILRDLHAHLFNDSIWPDFTKIPSPSRPVYRLRPIREGARADLGDGLSVTAVNVEHGVPAVGFVVSDGRSAVVYNGNTGPTTRLWEVAAKTPELKAAIIEVSFPNDLKGLAEEVGHLVPAHLPAEVRKLGRPDLPVYIYHIKPIYLDRVRHELHALAMPNLHILEDGQALEV